MSNYPPGLHAGSAHAPWNEVDGTPTAVELAEGDIVFFNGKDLETVWYVDKDSKLIHMTQTWDSDGDSKLSRADDVDQEKVLDAIELGKAFKKEDLTFLQHVLLEEGEGVTDITFRVDKEYKPEHWNVAGFLMEEGVDATGEVDLEINGKTHTFEGVNITAII